MAETRGTVSKKSTGQALPDPGEGRGHVVDDAKTAMKEMADAQKRKVADRLGSVGRALHETARGLDREQVPAGHYAELAAEQVDRLSDALRERGIEDLVGEAEKFARRQPLLFVGGALVAGMMLARFLKHSDQGAMAEAAEEVTEEAKRVSGEAAASVEQAGRQIAREAGEAGAEVASEVVSGTTAEPPQVTKPPSSPFPEGRPGGEPL